MCELYMYIWPLFGAQDPDTEEWSTMNISMKEEGQVGMTGLVVDPSDLIDCPTQVDWNKPFH